MKLKNRSGKTSLLTLYKKFQKGRSAVPIVISIAQLCVMYLIQNNFKSERLMVPGLLLLAASFLISEAVRLAIRHSGDN